MDNTSYKNYGNQHYKTDKIWKVFYCSTGNKKYTKLISLLSESMTALIFTRKEANIVKIAYKLVSQPKALFILRTEFRCNANWFII
jgi:hypothetical protein